MLVRDSAVDRVLLGPVAHFKSQKLLLVAGQYPVLIPSITRDSAVKAAKAAQAKIPRPPNAFIIYRQEHHAGTVANNPTLRNNDICKFIMFHLSILNSNLFKLLSLARCGKMNPFMFAQSIKPDLNR